MRKPITLIIAVFFLVSYSGAEKQQEEKKKYYGSYGTSIDTTSVQDISGLELQNGQKVQLKTTIYGTCAMKGCWMEVDDGNGGKMRVTFKDYGFFVPKEGMEGKETILEGIVQKTTYTVEELRHYAEDAGKSAEEIAAIAAPKEALAFVAEGVVIK